MNKYKIILSSAGQEILQITKEDGTVLFTPFFKENPYCQEYLDQLEPKETDLLDVTETLEEE